MPSHELTIPSTFFRADSTVTATNRRVDARLLQKLKGNHNAILAKRVRRVLLVCGPLANNNRILINLEQQDASPRLLFYATVAIGPVCQQIVIQARMLKHTYTTPTVTASPVLHSINGPVRVLTELGQSVLSSASTLTFTVDIPETADHTARGSLRLFKVGLALFATADTSAIATGNATHTSSLTTIEYSAALSHGLVLVASDTTIEPRLSIESTALSSTVNARVYPPWNRIPVATSDTLSFYGFPQLTVQSIVVYENPVSSFSPDNDGRY